MITEECTRLTGQHAAELIFLARIILLFLSRINIVYVCKVVLKYIFKYII